MSRKIVLLSDGTGNSSAKVWRTNVWRVFESLDLSDSKQVAFYDDGVGTADFKPVAILGGAFGYGLKRNAIDIYKFACRNYSGPDDEIFGFGFSRGAFTIRVVAGLIADQGLVTANTEAELDAKTHAAWRAYRRKNYHTKWLNLLQKWRDAPQQNAMQADTTSDTSSEDKDRIRDVKIRFLGLWDTVAAYGMPVEEMTRGISDWIWPLMLPNCKLDKNVKRACHALSIDDERTTFHPVLIDERDEPPLRLDTGGNPDTKDERISQVWFAGVHSNVGGGYPDDSLAQIPLIWIMAEAQKCDLKFKMIPDANPQTIGHPITAQDKDGRIYDPRAGLGGYYRYGPRDIVLLGSELLARGKMPAVPRIHESVLERIKTRAHAYAPVGLPREYAMATSDGKILSPANNSVEEPNFAKARWNGQQAVWNVVWWRRIVYFLTVIASLYLFAFPILKERDSELEFITPLRWVSAAIRTIEKFLLSAAAPWADGYARDPLRFLIVCAVLYLLLHVGQWLSDVIQGRMESLWRTALKKKLSDPGLS